MRNQTPVSSKKSKNPASRIIAVVLVVLAIYYVVVAVTGALDVSTTVKIEGASASTAATDSVVLRSQVQDIDISTRTMQLSILPVPQGSWVGERSGQFSEDLRIDVVSGGVITASLLFPAESVVDRTTVEVELERGDTFFPFDRPFSNFRLVLTDATDHAVPTTFSLENSARPWILNAQATDTGSAKEGLSVQVDGQRDVLSVTLVLFYLIAIVLTTLIAVVSIGQAILKKDLQFSNIIWLSATMISFPALRASMPGAPPIGTALDFVVFFPCICLVAGMLVWTGATLIWRESSAFRGSADRDVSRSENEELDVME